MSIWNNAEDFTDFDFVELRFAPVLRLPLPIAPSIRMIMLKKAVKS